MSPPPATLDGAVALLTEAIRNDFGRLGDDISDAERPAFLAAARHYLTLIGWAMMRQEADDAASRRRGEPMTDHGEQTQAKITRLQFECDLLYDAVFEMVERCEDVVPSAANLQVIRDIGTRAMKEAEVTANTVPANTDPGENT